MDISSEHLRQRVRHAVFTAMLTIAMAQTEQTTGPIARTPSELGEKEGQLGSWPLYNSGLHGYAAKLLK